MVPVSRSDSHRSRLCENYFSIYQPNGCAFECMQGEGMLPETITFYSSPTSNAQHCRGCGGAMLPHKKTKKRGVAGPAIEAPLLGVDAYRHVGANCVRLGE